MTARTTQTRLILVEGVPGSGKSTTGQWIAHLLEAQGQMAVWHHEQDTGHPVYRADQLQDATLAGPAACAAYHADARQRWAALVADTVAADRVTVLDSSFLQAPIASMQLAGCTEEVIAEHVAATAALLTPAHPSLILLRHADTTATYWQARIARGPGFEAYLAELVGASAEAIGPATRTARVVEALQAHAALVHRLAAETRARGMQGLTIDITSGDWPASRAAIAASLGVPVVDPHPPDGEVDGFTGRYVDPVSQQELIVARDERGLVLSITGTRLLPRRAETFAFEGFSIEMTFEPATGTATRMHCVSRMPDIPPVWERA